MNIDINGLGSGRPEGLKRQDGSNKTGAKTESGTPSPGSEKSSADSVSLSSNARDIAQIESEIKNLPEIDQSKVDAIKARIASGEYHIDFEKVAQKVLDIES